jgi:hypothetical protein
MRYLALALLCGCFTNLKVEPVKVEPIHMTIDVNVHNTSSTDPAKK